VKYTRILSLPLAPEPSNTQPPTSIHRGGAHGSVHRGALRLRALAYAAQDTLGYIIGAYGSGSDSNVLDTGKFMLALRRGGGGQWLIAGDIDHTNRR
jgi:hypothetical protein